MTLKTLTETWLLINKIFWLKRRQKRSSGIQRSGSRGKINKLKMLPLKLSSIKMSFEVGPPVSFQSQRNKREEGLKIFFFTFFSNFEIPEVGPQCIQDWAYPTTASSIHQIQGQILNWMQLKARLLYLFLSHKLITDYR